MGAEDLSSKCIIKCVKGSSSSPFTLPNLYGINIMVGNYYFQMDINVSLYY